MKKPKLTPAEKIERRANIAAARAARAKRALEAGRAGSVLQRLQGGGLDRLREAAAPYKATTRFGLGHQRGSTKLIGPPPVEAPLQEAIDAVHDKYHEEVADLLEAKIHLPFRGEAVAYDVGGPPARKMITSTTGQPYHLTTSTRTTVHIGSTLQWLTGVVVLEPATHAEWAAAMMAPESPAIIEVNHTEE